MKLLRYVCGCDTWNLPCYQSGRNHYIALPETEDDKSFELRITEFEQKGKAIWLGGKEANVLDFLSRVPQVEDHLLQSDFSRKLSKKRSYPRYQRRLDVPRAESIGEWWSKPDTSSVNAVVLAVNKNHHIGDDAGLENPEIHIHKEAIDENFAILKIKSNWLSNSCESCGNVKSQLEKVINGQDVLYTAEMKRNAEQVLGQITDWKNEQQWRTFDHAITFHCLNRLCPSFDDDGANKYHQHRSLSGGGTKVPPFEIIDGQHRVKGSQQKKSIKSTPVRCNTCEDKIPKPECEDPDDMHDLQFAKPPCEEKIAFSLVAKEGNFGQGFHGKLFTEITTEARKLEPEHQLYMQWRFSMETHRPSDLFEDGMVTPYVPESVAEQNGRFDYADDSLADLAYRVLLALNTSGPLAGRIRPLGKVLQGEDDPHLAYYLGSMKNMWIWMYDLLQSYFSKLLKLKADGSYVQKYSAESDTDVEAIRVVISNYFTACIEHFDIGDTDWAVSVNEPGRLSGPQEKDGSSQSSTGPVFHFQAMAFLAKYVFKEVAWDIWFEQNPEATEEDVTNIGERWKTEDPSNFTIENIKYAFNPLNGFDFGLTDGSTQKYYPGTSRGYLLADELAPFIEKPRTTTFTLQNVIVEVEDLELV